MNAAELMDRVFDVYKRSFWKQLAYAAIVATASTFALGLIIGVLGIGAIFIASVGEVSALGVTSLIFIFLAIIVFALLMQAALTAGAILLSRETFMGRIIRLPMKQLMGAILRAFTALLAQLILLTPFTAVVVGLVYGYIRFSFYVDILANSRLYYVLLIILLVAVVAGFLLFMHLFSLSVAVAVTERSYFFNALVRGVNLLRGDFWRLFGVRMIWFVIIFVFVGTAQGLLMLVPSLLGILFAGTPAILIIAFVLNMFFMVGSMAVSFAMYPLDGILTAVIFFNQRIKKEGLDMEISIEELYRAL
ncbi:MAG: hypothetical protein FWC71_01190 [Defluviitaleaceae bacterium]|nr:hypothetical protein [Defluviitaleaceae bacterium]